MAANVSTDLNLVASEEVVAYDSTLPIGIDDTPDIFRLRSRTERQKANNALAALEAEADVLKLIKDHAWVEMVFDMSRHCEDMRARTTWAKVVAKIARLGEREPEKAAAAIGTQINLTLVAPDAGAAERCAAKFVDVSAVEAGGDNA